MPSPLQTVDPAALVVPVGKDWNLVVNFIQALLRADVRDAGDQSPGFVANGDLTQIALLLKGGNQKDSDAQSALALLIREIVEQVILEKLGNIGTKTVETCDPDSTDTYLVQL